MTLVDAVAAVALVAMLFYGVLGGADFGGGFFHLFALGDRSRERRRAISEAMGPVWEANHVFLVLLVVVFFSAFPSAWAAYATALAFPLRLALVALAIRGVAFVFRAYAGPRLRAAFGVAFGVASVVAPFVLGSSVGAISSGLVRVDGVHGHVSVTGTPWLSPIAIAMGFTALAVSVHLAAVFLAVETTGTLRADFRFRAIVSDIVLGTSALVTLLVARVSAPHLYASLARLPAVLPIVVGSASWILCLGALVVGRVGLARVFSIVGVAALLAGWAVAQHPYLIYPDITLQSAAAPAPMLRFLLYSVPFGVALAGPSMWLAFRVFKSRHTVIRRELGMHEPPPDEPSVPPS